MENDDICLFGLSASKDLTQKIAKHLGCTNQEMELIHFADGEILTRSTASVRGKEVFLVQSTCKPVNDNLMELLIAIDALKRCSAAQIYAILPYFGYARQDRKAKSRQPITCKLVADMITTAGASKVMTVELHSPQTMGFFDVPMDDLKTSQEFCKCIIDIIKSKHPNSKLTLVSPDHGGLTRVRTLANYLDTLEPNIAVIDKRRPAPNVSEIEFILGDVKDKVCFIIDDLIDTGGTICNAARAIKKEGAEAVYILACHGVFSDPAQARLSEIVASGIVNKVIVTDTIPVPKEKQFPGLEIISIHKLLANVIHAVATKSSLSELYRNETLLLKKQLADLKK